MSRVNVPIMRITERTSLLAAATPPKLIGLFVLIMSSVLLGAYAEERYAFLRLPNVNPRSQLGSAGDSLPDQTPLAIVPPNNTPPTSRGETSVIKDAPLVSVDTTVSRKQLDDLSILTSEHVDAIAQLNRELELIKERSVALIVEFDHNCGNWKDECASPFAKELETNNSRYSQLVAKLATFNQELTRAQREQRALTQ